MLTNDFPSPAWALVTSKVRKGFFSRRRYRRARKMRNCSAHRSKDCSLNKTRESLWSFQAGLAQRCRTVFSPGANEVNDGRGRGLDGAKLVVGRNSSSRCSVQNAEGRGVSV